MASPAYTTDLTLAHDCDSASGSWTEPTGFTIGAITLPETDYYLQGTGCLSKNVQSTGKVGAIYNLGSGATLTANQAVWVWLIFSAPPSLTTEAAGGMQIFVGSATSAFKQFYVRGNDTYTYGGWICVPVCPYIDTGAITISVVATAGTFTRTAGGSGSFITDGFEVGQTITTTGFTNGGNNTTKVISTATATVITVTSVTGLVNETGNADERVRMCNTVTGAPSTTYQYFGAGVDCPTFAPTKGNAFGLDAVRYGRGEARFTGGDLANGYATFSGFSTQNDNSSNRWGLVQSVAGGYLWQGLMSLGCTANTTTYRARSGSNVATLTTATAHNFEVGDVVVITGVGGTGYNATAAVASTPTTTTFTYANTGSSESTTADTGGTISPEVDFRDSNKNISIANTKRVSSAFNRIEIRRGNSRVDWTAISFVALGTVSKGQFEVIDNADVNLSNCTFTDMDTFIFLAGGAATGCTWRRCMAVTGGGTDFSGSLFDSSAVASDAAAVVWDVNEDVDGHFDGCTFIEDGGGDTHAIRLGTSSPTSVTFRDCTFTGYSASDSATSSTFLVSRTTGNVTINVVGCSGNVTYKSAGAVVTISSNPITFSVTTKSVSGSVIGSARVFLKAADATGPMPYQESVTISRSGTTATVAHTGHGMVTNDKVLISGVTGPTDADALLYNGVYSITRTSDNGYTYTMSNTPSGNATGTIIATYVALFGETDSGTGILSDSRSFTSDQPVSGWARKSTDAPYYKEGPISDTIDSELGMATIAVLALDQ